jgi:hypothetical protein
LKRFRCIGRVQGEEMEYGTNGTDGTYVGRGREHPIANTQQPISKERKEWDKWDG